MFKRVFSPALVFLGLVAGVAVEEHYRTDEGDVIQSVAGPAPLCAGESRLSVIGKNAVADGNRSQRGHHD